MRLAEQDKEQKKKKRRKESGKKRTKCRTVEEKARMGKGKFLSAKQQ